MSWQKREVPTNLVILGDAEGNVASTGGLLASVTPDPRYPDNRRFLLIGKDGDEKLVAGFTALNNQLGAADVGKFIKLTFGGWGKSANGRFKIVEVQVWDGEPSSEMVKWLGIKGATRFRDLQQVKGAHQAPATGSLEEPPPGDPDDDDSLPF